MKVHEIISEGIWSDALSVGAKLVSKSAKAQALEKLTTRWAREILVHGKIVSKADDVIEKGLAADSKLVAKATKDAEKAAAKAVNTKNMNVIKGAVGGAMKKGAKAVNYLATAGIALDPIYEYNKRMDKWAELLKSGKITQEEYDSIRQKEMATMITHMTANIAGLAAFKSFGAGSKFLLGWIPGFKPIMTGLTTAGAAAMAYWWQTDEGRKWLTYAIMNELYDLSPVLGGVPVNWLDKLKEKIPGFNSEKPTAGGQGGAAPGQTTPEPAAAPTAAPTVAAQQGPQPGTAAGTNLKTTDLIGADGKPTFDIGWK